MRNVFITGIGQVPVGEHWTQSIRDIGSKAVLSALENAGNPTVDALYVGNAYSGTISGQSQLGSLIADYSNLRGIEAVTIEAAESSGAAALRAGYIAVASGMAEVVVVLGVEKMTDSIAGTRVKARNISLDADYETVHGATTSAMAALMMQRYMHEYGVDISAFEGFSVNAHLNGSKNPNAMFRNKLREGMFMRAPMVSSPVSLFDVAPDADGAAALILTHGDNLASNTRPVQIVGSASAVDTLALQNRRDILWLDAVEQSAQKALLQAQLTMSDMDIMELHDAYTIFTTLTIESMNLADRGAGWQFANQETIGLAGDNPISTFGGLKSRGNPAGATGVYQAIEAYLQLKGNAGDNQVEGAETALIQNLGGLGSTAITHILRAIG